MTTQGNLALSPTCHDLSTAPWPQNIPQTPAVTKLRFMKVDHHSVPAIHRLNALERMGLAVALQRDLSITPGEGRALALLMQRSGTFVSLDELDRAVGGTGASRPRRRLVKQMQRIRAALADLGIAGHRLECDPGNGYAISRHVAVRIWEALGL